MSPLQCWFMLSTLKFLLLTILVCLITSFSTGFLSAFIGSRIIPLTTRIDGDLQLGYAGDLLWLFFLGGIVGLILGIIVSIKIWKRVK